tara:strand:+ start:355 stop:828 length:474 start_codon:yes stop_codon:yes gene_type:complete
MGNSLKETFYIGFSDRDLQNPENLLTFGTIRIGEFEENFEVDGSYWDTAAYESRWNARLSDVCNDIRSGLIQSVAQSIDQMNFIRIWKFYPSGELVFVQEQLVFADDKIAIIGGGELSLEKIESDIDPYETTDKDGDKISTWQTNKRAIREFLKNKR